MSETKNANRLVNKLDFITEVFGTKKIAEQFTISPASITRATNGEYTFSLDDSILITELEAVLSIVLMVWDEEIAKDWFNSCNAHLESTPWNALHHHRLDDVISAALRDLEGAYS